MLVAVTKRLLWVCVFNDALYSGEFLGVETGKGCGLSVEEMEEQLVTTKFDLPARDTERGSLKRECSVTLRSLHQGMPYDNKYCIGCRFPSHAKLTDVVDQEQ